MCWHCKMMKRKSIEGGERSPFLEASISPDLLSTKCKPGRKSWWALKGRDTVVDNQSKTEHKNASLRC